MGSLESQPQLKGGDPSFSTATPHRRSGLAAMNRLDRMAFQLFTCRRPVAEEALPTVRLRERCAVRRGALRTIVPAAPGAGCGPYLASVLREA
jgi:hypothetical protein